MLPLSLVTFHTAVPLPAGFPSRLAAAMVALLMRRATGASIRPLVPAALDDVLSTVRT